MEPADLLRELTAGLDAAGIPHMIVGSFASTSYGEPRSTQGIDTVIDPDPASLHAWLAGLDRERWYVGDAETALARRDQFNLIELTSGWKIDIAYLRRWADDLGVRDALEDALDAAGLQR